MMDTMQILDNLKQAWHDNYKNQLFWIQKSHMLSLMCVTL